MNALLTTPFPSVPGSPVTRSDERYFCRSCLCTDYADWIEAAGSLTCSLCDSPAIVPLDVKRREDVLARDAAFAAADREAEARYEAIYTKRTTP